MTLLSRFLGLAGALFMVSAASGAITYIDAVPNDGLNGGNTTVNGVFADDTSNYVSGTGGTNGALQADSFWYFRTPTASTNNSFPPNKGTFWETDGTAVHENAEPLITTISVPAPGTYNLYVMFIALTLTGNTAFGDIEVDVNNSGTPKYFSYHAAALPAQAPYDNPGTWIDTHAAATEFAADSDPFPVGTQWTQQGYHMILGQLGEYELASTTVEFKITGPDAFKLSDGTPIYTRTLYEGVAYEAVSPPAVPGDFNSDGNVDGLDFVAWQSHFPKASNAVLSEGDGDGDGDVDGADFVIWQTNFPFSSSSGVTPLPEPNAFLLMLAGAIFASRVTRRRSESVRPLE